jgi:cytochrome P450
MAHSTESVAGHAEAPPHVPKELVWHNSIESFARELDDPFLSVSRLHDDPRDIVFATLGRHPGWVPTRFKIIEEVFAKHEIFSSAYHSEMEELLGVQWRLNPIEIDPPAHRSYRQILQPHFQPTAINALTPRIHEICRELIASFEDRGHCEFVGEFASLLPAYMFLALMGMPRENVNELLAWEKAYLQGETRSERMLAARRILALQEAFIAERRAEPREDLTSAIVAAQIDGRPIRHDEYMGMCYVLYLAGLDTVMSSLGWIMRTLVCNAELQGHLRACPADIPAAIEELLRAHGITATRRMVAKDCLFHGVEMKQGDIILAPTYLAGRDPREFPDPHRIDLARKSRHLSFATGVHNCLGVHLARRELRIVVEEFLARFGNLRVPDGEFVTFHTTGVWGVDRLPLTWDGGI